MAKPANLPEWASDGTLIVEPAAGLKATGWSNATRPPAKYMNWYKNLVYLWVQYLDLITTEDPLGAVGAAPWSPASADTLPAFRPIGDSYAVAVAGAVVTLDPGVGYWGFAAAGGNDAYGLAHTEQLDVAVGTGASNAAGGADRVDIVTVEIDEDNVLTTALVTGTPGAGAPATPAGTISIAELTMLDTATTYDTTLTRDLREPFGRTKSLIPMGIVTPSGNWTVGTNSAAHASSGGAENINIPITIPTSRRSQRLIRLRIVYQLPADASVTLQRSADLASGGSSGELADITAQFTLDDTVRTLDLVLFDIDIVAWRSGYPYVGDETTILLLRVTATGVANLSYIHAEWAGA